MRALQSWNRDCIAAVVGIILIVTPCMTHLFPACLATTATRSIHSSLTPRRIAGTCACPCGHVCLHTRIRVRILAVCAGGPVTGHRYDPFGKGGAGAPHKKNGQVRKRLLLSVVPRDALLFVPCRSGVIWFIKIPADIFHPIKCFTELHWIGMPSTMTRFLATIYTTFTVSNHSNSRNHTHSHHHRQ